MVDGSWLKGAQPGPRAAAPPPLPSHPKILHNLSFYIPLSAALRYNMVSNTIMEMVMLSCKVHREAARQRGMRSTLKDK